MSTSRRASPSLPEPPLLLITDRKLTRSPLEEVVAQALDAGLRWLLLRDRDLPGAERRALAERLQRQARAQGALFLVSADLDLAATLGADGVHLPGGRDPGEARARLGGTALIGCSTHSAGEAEAALRRGADYVTLSPVFASISKPGYGPALGPEGLREAARRLSGPLVALGGVTIGNAADCLAAGARGIAVMGAILQAEDPGAETQKLIAAIGG